ncbi:effector-associated constant component EACC1 [Streptomyces candidus]|uniref:Uncharacterized protein n=1 Tax=Streptomyces candidus TaxID=67283 RepID=A0A7X0LNB5_9ACTN|nr:hypothetical protein [Streptomyces candidus]MBB6434309.1 hypothetical protein [Streptomyces candidus]GHH37145.1 hypothetical protein GCM10018773_13480 [Streptomyces candidus]
MSATRDDRTTLIRISIVDDDPLRARREARELLGELSEVAPEAVLDSVRPQGPLPDGVKGGDVVALVGLVFSGGSLAIAAVQLWLSRTPQRTISLTRPDGACLRITGRQARADSEAIERFLSPRPGPLSPPLPDDGAESA